MQSTRVIDETPALLATMSVCGVGTDVAPQLLRRQLARLRQPCELARTSLYRAVVKAGRAAASSFPARPVDRDFPIDGLFDHLSAEIRVALFLLVVLEFSLREAADILESEPVALAGRIEDALAVLEARASSA
jgi:hypothetical protein